MNKLNILGGLTTLRVVLYFIVLSLATLVAGIIPLLDSLLFYFCLSFFMSYYFLRIEGKQLSSIGFIPRKKIDFVQLATGTGSGILMFTCNILLISSITDFPSAFHATGGFSVFLISFLFNLGSAFIQEFVFRGYPFSALLEKYGPWVAQLCIAVPFGLMHVHRGMETWAIMQTMLTTGVGSLIFGLAYIKTGKLFLPIGLHTGWNFAQQLFLDVWQDKRWLDVSKMDNTFVVFVVPYLLIMGIAFFVILHYRYKVN